MISRFTRLLFALTVLCSSLMHAQTFVGIEADKMIAGAGMVRMGEISKTPEFVQYREGKELPYAKFKAMMQQTFNWSAKMGFEVLNVEKDKLGMVHYRLVQTYEGRRVEGTMYIVHTKNERVQSFNGQIFDQVQVPNRLVISEKVALSRALDYVNAERYRWESEATENHLKEVMNNPNATWFPKGELVIVAEKGIFRKENLKLAYKFDIYAEKPLRRNYIFVDAANGQIIHEQNRIMDANTPATAVTAYSGSRNIITDSFAGGYRLRETGRGLGVETYNMLTGTSYGAAVDFTNATTTWNNVNANLDQYATDAHWGAEMTWDFYDSLFSRNSVDNAGQKLLSYVHYDQDYVNANWDGTHMNYGDGDAALGYTPLTAIDITGHEVSHGVTQFTSNLVYQDEPGALNEGFSDCMGVAIRQFARNPPVMDWLIGNEIGGTPFRNMANPNQYGDPDTYGGTNWHAPGGTDNGGVHQNSGVLNFWFYLMTMGGTGTNDNSDAYAVTALGLEKASQILYRAQNLYNTPNTQFAGARANTIQAAIDLYGPCTNEVIQTTNAWHAVGVGAVFVAGVTAGLSADITTFCSTSDTVQFINLSNNAGFYTWHFGDGTTSTAANPFHVYNSFGVYDVKLVADGGSCGIDSVLLTSYITIDAAVPCTVTVGTNTVQTACTGTVYDSGGPSDNYIDNTNFTITIAPSGSSQVILDFITFNMENNYDYVRIYDGPSMASPLIGTYTGTTVPANVNSSGGAITIQQTSDGGLTAPGFQIAWSCVLPTAPPVVNFSADVTNSCTGIINFDDNSVGGANTWLWRFGDGNTSTNQNPVHVYTASGIYQVTLIATNTIGTDSLVQSNYITVNLPVAPTPVVSPVTINCGDDAILDATGNAELHWFDVPIGGNLLDTGSTYNTPIMNSNGTYYVQSVVESPSNYMNPPSNAMGNGSNYTNNTFRALVFDVLSPVVLVSVKVYATGTANRTIQLRNSAGVTLQSITLNIPDGVSRPVLNLNLPVGTGYQLGIGGGANLYRNSTGANYPYTFPGMLSITGNTAAGSAGYYYFFYEWEIQAPACLSARTPIDVLVNEPIPSFSSTTLGLTTTFTNSSVGATSYLWDFGDGNTSTASNPVHTYNFDGIYTVMLYAYSGNCVDSSSITLNLITTGISAGAASLSLNIFPNPNAGLFTIQVNSLSEELMDLSVVNALGQLVYNASLGKGKQAINLDLSSEAKGIYFVKLANQDSMLVKKLILH
jgi:Zn-dependent metalloprotease/PKD repeat protein